MNFTQKLTSTCLNFQVIDFERDIKKAREGDVEDLTYQKITGLKPDLTGTTNKPDILDYDDVSESGSGEDGSSSGDMENSDRRKLFIFYFD